MAVSGDVTFSQDGAHGNVKLHPYLVALVRWCVECLWNSATVVLHRLLTPLPLPPAASKPAKRPATSDHLDPEPRVECQVLHQPLVHGIDVVFVHGLYGSLANTWRQGEWTSKYQRPETVHLSRPKSLLKPCHCPECAKSSLNDDKNRDSRHGGKENGNDRRNIVKVMGNIDNEEIKECSDKHKLENYDDINKGNTFTNVDEKFYKDIEKILPDDEIFITERFYNETLLDQIEIVDNYETQAKFVSDLFKKSCDNDCDEKTVNIFNDSQNNGSYNVENESFNDKGVHKVNADIALKKSDLYRNENLITNDEKYNDNKSGLLCNKIADTSIACECRSSEEKSCEAGCGCNCDGCYSSCWPRDWIKVDFPEARVISINYTSDPHLWRPLWVKENKRLRLHERAEQMMQQLLQLGVGERPVVWVGHSKGGLFIKQIYCEAYEAYLKREKQISEEQNMTELSNDNKINDFKDGNGNNGNNNDNIENDNHSSNDSEKVNFTCHSDNEGKLEVIGNNFNEFSDDNQIAMLNDRDRSASYNSESTLVSSLWSSSVGFMFYSVPHRGAPLADIKTPITARSVELLEISKDCSLVISLQERWLRAASASARAPLVRSLVETRRTLMSVLWLRIVSAQSADPGIGPLCGVSVDHREICKPSSRRCLLYTELAALIRSAINNAE